MIMKFNLTRRYVFCIGVLLGLLVGYIFIIFLPHDNWNNRHTVVFFGDSITQFGYTMNGTAGWVARLGDWWSRKADISNRGYSGYNTRWALEVYDHILKLDPDLLIIFFGANDAAITSSPQHVSPQEFRSNLLDMVHRARQWKSKPDILVISPPPIDEEKLRAFNRHKGKGDVADKLNNRTKEYARIVVEMAKEVGIAYVDAWNGLYGPTEGRSKYLVDGIHLNERGNAVLFDLIVQCINRQLPYWRPADLDNDLPPWQQVAKADAMSGRAN